VKKLEEKYKGQVESLVAKCKDLEESKIQMKDEFVAKLEKARLFYEKELEAVMKMNNISTEEAQNMLKAEKEKLQKDYAAKETELKKQLNSALSQLNEREDEVEKLKEYLKRLEMNAEEKDSNSLSLSKQVKY
jgi:ribosomal protein L22